MAKKPAARGGNNQKPKAGASMQARAARAGKPFEPEAVVSAVTPKNTELTKPARGPGRPRKEAPKGNLYSVSYFGGGDSASAPKTRIVQTPDESTAICAANKLNGLGSETYKYQIRATLINGDGEPLDTDYLPQTELDAGQMAAAAGEEDLEDIEGEDGDDEAGDDE